MSYKSGFYKGRLGIGLANSGGDGTGNPRFPLDVNGDIRLTGSLLRSDGTPYLGGGLINYIPKGIKSILNNDGSYYVGFGSHTPTEALDISGNLKVSGQILSVDGDNFSTVVPITQQQTTTENPTWHGNVTTTVSSSSDSASGLALKANIASPTFTGTVTIPELNITNNLDVTGSISPLVGMVCFFAKTTAPTGWLSCSGQFISKTNYSNLYSVIGDTYGSNSTEFKLPDLRGNFIRCLNTSSSGTDTNRNLSTFQDFSTGQPQQSSFTANSAGSHGHTASSNAAGSHNHTASTAAAGNHNHSASSGNAGAHRHSQGYWYNYSGNAYGGWHDPRMWAGAFGVGSWGSSLYTGSNANEGGKVVGNHTHSVTVNHGGSHSHSVTVNNGGSHSHTITVNNGGSHQHSIGGGDSETRPKNYALLACIKY